MYSRIREQFSTTAIILSIIALVFALGGGAYAASEQGQGEATASKGKRGKPGKRGPRGPQGKEGPQGPVGPVGPQGAAGLPGPKGDPGQQGIQGIQGSSGAAGKSVEVEELEVGGQPQCEETGGILVKVKEEPPATAKEVCNGEKGEPGEDGTFDFSIGLEPDQEETGVWIFNNLDLADGELRLPVSLTVHLNAPVWNEETKRVWLEGDTNFADHCGGSEFNPEVKNAAELCIYTTGAGLSNATFSGAFQLGASGIFPFSTGLSELGGFLKFVPTADNASGQGIWAVRGCSTTLPPADPDFCPEE